MRALRVETGSSKAVAASCMLEYSCAAKGDIAKLILFSTSMRSSPLDCFMVEIYGILCGGMVVGSLAFRDRSLPGESRYIKAKIQDFQALNPE